MSASRFSTRNVLSGFCLILLPLAVVSPNAVVPLLIITALLAGICAWRETGRLPRFDRMVALLLGLMLVWAAISATWSFDRTWAFISVLRLAILFLAGLILFEAGLTQRADERRTIVKWLLAGFGLGILVFLIEGAFDFPFHRLGSRLGPDDYIPQFRLNRPAVALTLMTWPLTSALVSMKGRMAAFLPVAIFGIVLLSESDSALLGLVAGLLFSGIAMLSRRWGRRILSLAVVVGFLSAPLIGAELHAIGLDKTEMFSTAWDKRLGSAQHRIYIWGFVADRIAERPFLGWGFDSSRHMPDFGTQPFNQGSASVIPLHPHNAVLQIWLELGVPGLLLTMGLVLLLIRRLDRLSRTPEIYAQAMIAGTLLIVATSYGIWQNMWISTLFAAAALVPLCDFDKVSAGGGAEAGRRE